VKKKHGRKKLLIVTVVYAILAVTCFFLSPALTPVRPLLDICVIFAPTLAFYFLSRRFEYAADRASVEFTQDPKAAIHALANLYRFHSGTDVLRPSDRAIHDTSCFCAPGLGNRSNRSNAC
jgi:Zn-dependent protease with chaperone function